jgi:hypothetical protein
MAYHKTARFSRQLAAARLARERRRLEGPSPDYPPDLPDLRRELLVIEYDTGFPILHHLALHRSDRVDCYHVVENGVPWRGRWGFARVLAIVRQRFPRVRAP